MGKLLFVSSTTSLLQFVIVGMTCVLAVGKSGFDSLHGRAWLHPPLHPLSRCWFGVDLIVECKMTLNIFWCP